MSVYVDDARIPFRHWKMSHLFADTEDELHEFAARLGLKREWFQPRKGLTRHYDVTDSKREQAIRMGAKPITYPRGVAELVAAEALH